jgi:hypothetical protein
MQSLQFANTALGAAVGWRQNGLGAVDPVVRAVLIQFLTNKRLVRIAIVGN